MSVMSLNLNLNFFGLITSRLWDFGHFSLEINPISLIGGCVQVPTAVKSTVTQGWGYQMVLRQQEKPILYILILLHLCLKILTQTYGGLSL